MDIHRCSGTQPTHILIEGQPLPAFPPPPDRCKSNSLSKTLSIALLYIFSSRPCPCLPWGAGGVKRKIQYIAAVTQLRRGSAGVIVCIFVCTCVCTRNTTYSHNSRHAVMVPHLNQAPFPINVRPLQKGKMYSQLHHSLVRAKVSRGFKKTPKKSKRANLHLPCTSDPINQFPNHASCARTPGTSRVYKKKRQQTTSAVSSQRGPNPTTTSERTDRRAPRSSPGPLHPRKTWPLPSPMPSVVVLVVLWGKRFGPRRCAFDLFCPVDPFSVGRVLFSVSTYTRYVCRLSVRLCRQYIRVVVGRTLGGKKRKEHSHKKHTSEPVALHEPPLGAAHQGREKRGREQKRPPR